METLIGERINQVCEKLHLSKADLSRKIGLDNNATISRIATGKVNPSYEVLKKMAEALPEINFNWLLSGEGEMLSGYKPEKKLEPSEREIFKYMQQQLEEQKKMIDFLMDQLRSQRESLNPKK
jgi:transcriptional regulator with XRE-family HTH domain